MAAYGDLPTIKQMLNLEGTDHDDRLDALNTAMSAVLDAKTGRTFGGDTPAPETRTVRQDASTDVLALPWPLVSVDSIAINGQWDGADWDTPDVLDAEDYRLRTGPDGFVWVIDLYRATAAEYRITGVWGDQAGVVPPLVVEAVNVMVTRAYKRDEAGAGSEAIGPVEFEAQAPQGILTDDRVKTAIEEYRIVEHVL